MVETTFSDANILNILSGGSLLPGHTVHNILDVQKVWSNYTVYSLYINEQDFMNMQYWTYCRDEEWWSYQSYPNPSLSLTTNVYIWYCCCCCLPCNHCSIWTWVVNEEIWICMKWVRPVELTTGLIDKADTLRRDGIRFFAGLMESSNPNSSEVSASQC